MNWVKKAVRPMYTKCVIKKQCIIELHQSTLSFNIMQQFRNTSAILMLFMKMDLVIDVRRSAKRNSNQKGG